MIAFDNQTADSFYRWWVVHLWVEGVWELIMGGILCYLLIKLTGVDREVVEKWLYIIVGLTFISGILGTGHHYYFIGVPRYWLIVGGIFSALEPLAFLGMAMYALAMAKKGGRKHPNKIALTWTLGCAIMAFVGAGFPRYSSYHSPSEHLDSRHTCHRHARTLGFLGSLRNDHFCYDRLRYATTNRAQTLGHSVIELRVLVV